MTELHFVSAPFQLQRRRKSKPVSARYRRPDHVDIEELGVTAFGIALNDMVDDGRTHEPFLLFGPGEGSELPFPQYLWTSRAVSSELEEMLRPIMGLVGHPKRDQVQNLVGELRMRTASLEYRGFEIVCFLSEARLSTWNAITRDTAFGRWRRDVADYLESELNPELV